MKQIIRLMVLSLLAVLLLPAFIAGAQASPTTEAWGVSTGQKKYFTVGTDLSANLPDDMWDYVNTSLWEAFDDMFNNSYDVGYDDYYAIGYEAGWDQLTYSEPYSIDDDRYKQGANDGYYNGYWDGSDDEWASDDISYAYQVEYENGYMYGFYDWGNTPPYPVPIYDYEIYSNLGHSDGYTDGEYDRLNLLGYMTSYDNSYSLVLLDLYYLNSYYNEYEGVPPWGGFPIEDEIAFDARTLIENALNLPTIFNVEVTITNMAGESYQDEVGHWETSWVHTNYYYEAGQWVPDYTDPYGVYHGGYYAPINGNYEGYYKTSTWVSDGYTTVQYDEINITARIKLPTDVTYLPFENFTIHYGQDVILPFIAANLPGQLKNNITAKINEGLTDMQSSIDDPMHQFVATDDTIMQWVSNVILPEDAELEYMYQYGVDALLPIGGYPGSISDYGGPQMYAPLFIPTDTNFRPTFEKAKDLINWQLSQVHGVYLAGGFNGIVEQLGADVIVKEKEIYFGVHNLDFQYFFGAVADLGGRFFLDMVQDFFDTENIISTVDNSSLDASAIMAMRWDTDGVLQNFHTMFNVGAKYDVFNTMGVTVTLDLSAGVHSTLSTAYTGKPTAPAPLPPELYFDWGVTEGSVNHWTAGYDFSLEIPQPVWDLLDEQLAQKLNNSFEGGFPESELNALDAKAIYDAIDEYIPNIVHVESKVTDMFTVAMREYYDSESEWVESHYDGLISTFKAKLPTESVYRPVLTMAMDYYDGLHDLVTDVFPGSIGANITFQLDQLESMVKLPIEGIPLFDIVSQLVYAVPFVWGSTSASFIPQFAKDLGITQASGDIYGNVYALPSTMYVPLTMDFQTAYDDWISWMHSQDSSFDETKVDSFLNNMSVDELQVAPKEIYVLWNIDGITDTFFDHVENSAEAITSFIDGFDSLFGITLNNDTLHTNVVFALRYDEFGVLDNVHLEVGFSIQSNTGQVVSMSMELDMSQGEYQAINQRFLGPIETTPTTPTSPFNIPGFAPFFLLLASIGAVVGILIKKRQ